MESIKNIFVDFVAFFVEVYWKVRDALNSLRVKLGILTKRERLVKRLERCFTTIREDDIKIATEDRLKRQKISQIRSRKSFSEEELKNIDETSKRKRVEEKAVPDEDFCYPIYTLKLEVEERMKELAVSVSEKVKNSLKEDFNNVMGNINRKWDIIDKSVASCWVYVDNEVFNYDAHKNPLQIANEIARSHSVELFVEMRNELVALVEVAFLIEFDRLLEEMVTKKEHTKEESVCKVISRKDESM